MDRPPPIPRLPLLLAVALVVSFSVLCLAFGAEAKTVYTWKDSRGVFHMSDRPPPEDTSGVASSEAGNSGRSSDLGRFSGGKIKPGVTATGTGFVVSPQGHVLTNWHVVSAGRRFTTYIDGKPVSLSLEGSDKANDLALLKLPSPAPAYARFRSGRPARSGDAVVALGYPLQGILASEANVTAGIISALAGPGNDARLLQMTAPVQPGNSGGPLLDMSGAVVGVVTAKLNALMAVRTTGDIPQNVNFAINSEVAGGFLRRVGAPVETAPLVTDGPGLSAADVGELAKRWTLLIECSR